MIPKIFIDQFTNQINKIMPAKLPLVLKKRLQQLQLNVDFSLQFFFFRAKTDSIQRLTLLVFNLITIKCIDLYPVSYTEREESVNMKVRCYLKTCE